ncbi:methionyl-tRNA formyltransferase [Sphaerotilus mobilis]|uniref:methionyl-tRNA formyltransferase n=1 Tax=Sphaerotilus mobilis TaxID=47994 RepID=UPI00102CB68C|nr:methionyl-tRNA formyltransferase [Sphaerotilus mobilis]
MRVAYAGTPEFAATALAAILAAGHVVPLVLTQPDRPAGRGMKLQASPVKQLAQQHGVPVVQSVSLKLDGRHPADAAAAREALLAAAPDVLVVAAYGLILPEWVLTLPRLGCLNIHASLLPRWRGAAPIHRAIEAGDPFTGITLMQMDAGLDTGPMLLRAQTAIGVDETTATLHDRLAAQGAALVLKGLTDAALGRLNPVVQPTEGVTYAHKIEKAEAAIDWRYAATVIERRVRAFDPFPGATCAMPVDGGAAETVKVWATRLADAAMPAGAPGQVLAVEPDGLCVACGEGALWLTRLQRPGGKRVTAREFLQVRPLAAGLVLS